MNGQTILVVDDDPVLLKSLSIKLNAKGYKVVTASDASEAVRAVRTQIPGLILLDLTFPPDVAHGGGLGWDGFLIMRWLKRMEEAANIPIIVITAGDPAQYEERSRQVGAAGFLHKPIDHDKLFELLRKTVGEPSAPIPPSRDPVPTPLPQRQNVRGLCHQLWARMTKPS